ncbi:MAG TPA: MASE1 domain-containing protein [Xanthobacteraceae bacterium]|nr:MASE1 domain-containing protein [Xanthobacteraceae bacterium]
MSKDPPHRVTPGMTAADLAQRSIRQVGLAGAIAVAYFLAAQLSLGLLTQPDGVAVFWPAAGISSGVLIALGPAARLPVAIGAIAATIMANLIGDRTLSAAIADAFCNAFEALLTAWLVERYVGLRIDLGRLTHVLTLLAAAIVATAISGVGGILSYQLFHNSPAPPLTTWQHWFTSDAVGIVTVAPLVIGLAAALRQRPARRELLEGIVALGALALMTGVIISLPPELWETVVPVASLFPMLLWLAARCRPVFAAAGSFVVSLTIVSTLIFGVGHFGNSQIPIAERILTAQAGILVVALCALVLAALFAERREHEAELSDSQERLQQALTAGRVTAFDWDLRTGSSRLSENAAQILGIDPRRTFTAADFVARIHPDDRARHQALVDSVSPESPSYADAFRFLRPDGQQIWLEATATVDFDAAGRPVRLKGLTRDITARKRAEERQDLLIAELDHRVKNVLARVAVVAMYTREGSRSMDEFVKVLDGRIQSMATAHSLLSESRWHGVGLIDLVHHQVAPYATDANVTINGSNAMLSAAETQAVAMVIHELVTNAAKYGALSCPGGHVLVTWRCETLADDSARLQIEWRETGGPLIQGPVRPGYGTSLIRELIPHELGGKVDLELASVGASCRIEIPLGVA